MKNLITVIVPTYNRKQLLNEALEAILKQTITNYEVIVVDDGSSDGTFELLQSIQDKNDGKLTFLTQKNGGPASARNRAINKAKGNIIAFTDDDCVVATNWLEVIQSSFDADSDLIGLQGRTSTDKKAVTPFTHQIDNEHGFDTIPTCNAAYKLDVLKLLGGFDESFPFPHNEDADLAWRAREIGKVAFNPEMHVYHPPRKDSFQKVSKRMRILESEFLLFHKNPSLYRKYRASSPWYLIYRTVMLDTHWYYLKSRLKYYKHPLLMLNGLRLSLYWWMDLIRLYPKFKAADKKYKQLRLG
jgi:glycosyltransferase involved in cell wall biosynthesis